MSLSQPQADLAVLYKLRQHADGNGPAVTSIAIGELFSITFPHRRIEVALDTLEAKGLVERQSHWQSLEIGRWQKIGRWQISREGYAKVDRALRAPTSFIARIHVNGDEWLQTPEAESAVIKNLDNKTPLSGLSDAERQQWANEGTYVFSVPPEPEPKFAPPHQPPIVINNAPVFNNNNENAVQPAPDNSESLLLAKSSTFAGWSSFWVAIAGLIITSGAAYLSYLQFLKD